MKLILILTDQSEIEFTFNDTWYYSFKYVLDDGENYYKSIFRNYELTLENSSEIITFFNNSKNLNINKTLIYDNNEILLFDNSQLNLEYYSLELQQITEVSNDTYLQFIIKYNIIET